MRWEAIVLLVMSIPGVIFLALIPAMGGGKGKITTDGHGGGLLLTMIIAFKVWLIIRLGVT